MNVEELLRVSLDEEGGHLKFDTLDGISIRVPIHDTMATANKIMPPDPTW